MAEIKLAKKLIGPYGFGLMGLTWRADPCPQSQAFETMREALKLGANFWNGGEFYGPPERNSLVLLNEYFQKYPEDQDRVVLSIKGGGIPPSPKPDGSEKNVRRSVEQCLSQLQKNGVKKAIDIFQCARVDPDVPIEDTISYLAKLVKEGKIGAIGLSEVSARTIRRAAAVHPIAAVEIEFSIWSPENLDNGVIATCAELGIPVIAYSPLGGGSLTGKIIEKNADIPESSMNKSAPKYGDDVLAANLRIVHAVQDLAEKKGCTRGQAALAWVRGYTGRQIQSPSQAGPSFKCGEIIPIPGSTRVDRVRENTRPDIKLSADEMQHLDNLMKQFKTRGHRQSAAFAVYTEG